MRQAIKKFNSILNICSSALLAFLMLMTVVDVLVRKIMGSPFSGTYELTMALITVIVYLGFAHANDYKEHVVIDILYEALPFIGKRISSFIATLINLGIVSVMFYCVVGQAIRLYGTGANTSALKIPHWTFAAVAAVGMFGFILSIIGDMILVVKEGRVLSNDHD